MGARLAALALAVFMVGCASLPPPSESAGADLETRCEEWLAAFDRIVAEAGTGDAESARVPGFPYLRTDRFLASHRLELPDDGLPAWTGAMMRLDREARAVERRNLEPAERERLRAAALRAGLMDADAAVHVEGCGKVLRARDLEDPAARQRLREAAAVPDDYQTWKRIAGLYGLTRVPFALGVRGYERGVLETFAQPADALPVRGRIVSYAPAARQGAERVDAGLAAQTAARVSRAGAAFEAPDPWDVAQLLALHAPVLEVDEALPEDRVGAVRLGAEGAAFVDTGHAVVYGRVAFTRFGGRVLPQVVYTAWFPGRPKTSAWDVLGGDWDALVWRATLDEAGRPLVFDTMHACGCYHMFFPTPRVAERPLPGTLDEWALVPQRLPAPAPGERVRLRIASGTHYLVRVHAGDAPAVRPYGIAPEAALRSLAGADGAARSLYGPDGIVPGSERGERYLFWPMGIREPGAMRQWGRHATAFVGRRHFDDAHLLDRYFILR
jgi:hypothetical protein